VLFVDGRVNLVLDFRLQNMINGQMERNPRQGARPTGITIDECLGIELGAVRIR
jgi:hypothetical protein